MEGKLSLPVSEILPYIGEYGRFQILLDVIFSVMNMPVAMQILITTFSTISPQWRCKPNNSLCTHNGTFSPDDERRCDLLRDSWEYTEGVEFSLVTQFNIHCKDKWILQLVSSIGFVSWGIGAIVLGWFGDRYGRKALMFPSFTFILLFGFISAFMKNIFLIVTCRFFVGFFLHGATTQGYILISEFVGNKQRPFASTIIFLSTSIGWCLLPLQAYLIPNWKTQSIISTAPYIVLLVFYKVVPESIEFLSAKGRTDEAIKILQTIGKWNKKELPKNITISLPSQVKETAKPSLLDLFQTRKIAIHSMALFFVWFVTPMNYYGIYMAADDLGGSLYRDFVILSLGDVPALFISMYVSRKFGRKICSLGPMLIGGVACIIIGSIPLEDQYKVYRIVLGNVGKMFICVSFNGIYTWAVEIYPTKVRSIGMGFTTVAGRAGSAAAPWVVKGLKPFGNVYPFLALGIPALVGFLIGLVLPETKEKISSVSNKREEDDNLNNEMHDKSSVNVSYEAGP